MNVSLFDNLLFLKVLDILMGLKMRKGILLVLKKHVIWYYIISVQIKREIERLAADLLIISENFGESFLNNSVRKYFKKGLLNFILMKFIEMLAAKRLLLNKSVPIYMYFWHPFSLIIPHFMVDECEMTCFFLWSICGSRVVRTTVHSVSVCTLCITFWRMRNAH